MFDPESLDDRVPSARRADPNDDPRELRRLSTPFVLAFATFVVAAATVAFQQRRADEAVLATITILIVLAARTGGWASSVSAALLGALSFDFFHVHPTRILHLRTALVTLGLLVLVATLTAREECP